MSRKSKSRNNSVADGKTTSSQIEIDYDKLAQSIITAHNEISRLEEEKRKKEEEKEKTEFEKQKAERRIERHKVIGYKDYPKGENLFLKIIHLFRNIVSVFFHFLFLKKENVKSDSATIAIIQTITIFIYWLIKWGLYILSIVLLSLTFINNIDLQAHSIIWQFRFEYLLYSVLTFAIAKAFRIAVFEIENMDDKNFLLSIFTGTTSFLALLIAVISLIYH